MDKFRIFGPTVLSGEVVISGAKNSALPILFATLLTKKLVKIKNIPNLKDVDIAMQLLHKLGVKIIRDTETCIDASNVNVYNILPRNLVNTIRGSIWMLAPLVARFGYGGIFFPGGCEIGSRPIDLHISALKKLGVIVELDNGFLRAYVDKGKLHGARIIMDKVSVGATLTIMSAASLAEGTTIIENAACEPEVVDTANFLIMLGSNIIGAGSNRIIITGVRELGGGTYQIIPDRIETGTFLVAGAISRAYVICKNSRADILTSVLDKLREAGADIKFGYDWISLDMHGQRPKAVTVCTKPYPGFPTDMQAQFSLLNVVSSGIGVIEETIFENRFTHIPELKRMGANIKIKNNFIVCHGVDRLNGAHVISTNLRASASLILAGCIAQGTTIVENIYHVDRGYDSIEKKLRNIGASIERF